MSLLKTELILKAEIYGTQCHAARNLEYDGKPYSYHLRQVLVVAVRYLHLLAPELHETVIAGCWVHDAIEDTGVTYNDVCKATNLEVAEIAYAMTTPKGKNRKERHCDAYYQGIRDTPGARFLKICDRIANVTHSRNTQSTMFSAYQREAQHFRDALWTEEYSPMFGELDQLLSAETGS